jgi:hypothetical protein
VYFEGKVKGKKGMFLDEKEFCKEGFVLKIIPNVERRSKDKPSEGSECYIKVLSKS